MQPFLLPLATLLIPSLLLSYDVDSKAFEQEEPIILVLDTMRFNLFASKREFLTYVTWADSSGHEE